MAEQPDAPAHRVTLRRQVAAEHGAGAAGERLRGRRRPAAPSSCRRRSGRAAARSRRARRAGRRRPAPGSCPSTATAPGKLHDRHARSVRDDPTASRALRRAPILAAPLGSQRGRVRRRSRPDAWTRARRGTGGRCTLPGRAVVALGPTAPAARLALGRRRDRAGAHRHRPADVRLRRLPAVGHRAGVRPGAGPPRGRLRRAARHGAGDERPRRHGDRPRRPPRRPDATPPSTGARCRPRPRRRRCPRRRPARSRCPTSRRATSWRSSRSRRSASRRTSCRGSSRATSRRAPGTTRTRRSPASSATRRSPGTARRTASRSTASTR